MSRKVWMFALATAAVYSSASITWAQGRGGMGGNSAFGGGGMGGSSFGSSFGGGGFGQSGFGGGMGSTGFGGGGFGQSGFGGGMGTSGFGGSAFSRGGGMGGSSFGGGGFGGQTGGMGGQSFVGRDGGDMQAMMGQMGRAGAQFFNTMNRNMSRNNQQQPTGDNERPPIRIRLEVGFNAAKPAPSAVARNITTRLASLAVDHSVGQPQVLLEGDTVVLRGIAESESQRQVLERFVLLEPGVIRVRNEMIVAAPSSEEPLPASGN